MHHQRRKSGNTSTADLRRLTTTLSDTTTTTTTAAAAAATAATTTTTSSTKHKRPNMTRRQTSSNQHRSSRHQRERDDSYVQRESESFPQFCMICDKQFVPSDNMFLYCSDPCRRIDQNSSSQAATVRGYKTVNYSPASYSMGKPEPRDIVPRASPSRPTSMYFNNSPPASPGTTLSFEQTSAISALRSLQVRPPSPPSPTVWPPSRSAAASLSNSSYSSFGQPSMGRNLYSTSHQTLSHETERSLTSRRPSGYSRPKSIELVTPLLSR